MANRPPFFGYIDLSLSNVDMNYLDNPLTLVGFAAGQTIPSREHNTLWLIDGLWSTYLDYGTLRLSDYIDVATPQQWSSTQLAYTIGANVTGGGGAVVASFAAYQFGGYRISITDEILKLAGASPLLVPFATAPGRIWVYANVNTITLSTPTASVRVESVVAGSPAAPLAGELALVGVDVDGTGAITANVYPGSVPVNEVVYSTVRQRWRGRTNFDELATFDHTDTVIDATSTAAASPTARITNSSGGNALEVVGPTLADTIQADAIAVVGAQPQPTVDIGPAVFDPSLQVVGNGALSLAQAALHVDGDVGYGGYVFSSGTTPTFVVEGTGVAARTLEVYGENFAVWGQSTFGRGIYGQGGDDVLGAGVEGQATHVGAPGVRGNTLVNANVTTYGVEGRGGVTSGSGVRGLGIGDGYGVVAEADTTSPVRAALRIVPQNADASSPQQGDVAFNSARGPTGKLRTRTTQWESVHSSAGGWVKQWGAPASGSTAGGSGNLSLVQISPEEVGTVLLTVTGTLSWTVDNGTATVQIVDITSGLTVATSLEQNVDVVGASITSPNNSRTFAVHGVRTLPNTATRDFAVVITANIGAVAYANVVCIVEGVQVP